MMWKNTRAAKILHKVVVEASSETTSRESPPSIPQDACIQKGTDIRDLPILFDFELQPVLEVIECTNTLMLDLEDSIQPGFYTVQNDDTLNVELEKFPLSTTIIRDHPKNIIINSDRSLRKSEDSNGSVSILSNVDDEIPILNTALSKVVDHDKASPPMSDGTKSAYLEVVDQGILTEPPLANDEILTSKPASSELIDQSITSPPLSIDDRQEDLLPSVSKGNDTGDEPSRKRRKKSDAREWTININNEKREHGKSYLGKKKVEDKWRFSEPKSEREMKAACECKLSKKEDSKIQCAKISEGEREQIFKNFWKMSWKEKKVYVKTSTVCKDKARERCTGSTSRRQHSVELFLTNKSGIRIRVCKTMFLRTLGVGEWIIRSWIIQETSQDETSEIQPQTRGNNKKVVSIIKLRAFFDSLPKLESHYCRKNTSKLYLEPLWTSKAQLYDLAYKKDFCIREQIEPLSITSFSNMFESLNLSLYRPKKDLCDICESYKVGNITEEAFKIHCDKKDEARKEMAKDMSSEHEVLTMDLQSVLLSPRSNVSSLYYKTKLIVHNFTVYDCKRNKGYCYIWNESEGKLTSNEFSSIIIAALNKFREENPSDKNIILYSDGCTYQNRNAVLSNALLNYSMEKRIL